MPDDVAQSELGHLLRGQPEIMQEGAIDVLAALVAVDVRHRRGHAVHDRAQLRFARGQGVLRLLQVGDVVADDIVALDRPVETEVGDDAIAQPPLPAVGVHALALVGDALAFRGALDVRPLEFDHIGTEHVLGGLAQHVVAIEAYQAKERVVDKAVAAVLVDVYDRLGNVVGEQPQLLLARRERLLDQLEVVDVVFRAIQPANLAGAVQVRGDAAVHPSPLVVD